MPGQETDTAGAPGVVGVCVAPGVNPPLSAAFGVGEDEPPPDEAAGVVAVPAADAPGLAAGAPGVLAPGVAVEDLADPLVVSAEEVAPGVGEDCDTEAEPALEVGVCPDVAELLVEGCRVAMMTIPKSASTATAITILLVTGSCSHG